MGHLSRNKQGPEAGRVSNVGFRAACALGLLALGLADTAGQQDAKPVAKDAPKAEVKKAAVPVNAAGRVAVDDNAVQQWEQHYGPQLRQLLRTELHFMRLAAQPTKPQYEKIAAESEPAIKEAIRGLVLGMSGRA